jgi:plastocyanin
VRLRPRHLVIAITTGLAGLLLAGPALSDAPSTASIVASDFAWKTDAGAAPDVTVGVGGAVGFSYPSGSSQHNVVFTGAQPSECQTITGPASGSRAPLPTSPSGLGWSGICRFDTAGTYPFVCGMHPGMTGSVTVGGTTGGPPPPPPPPPPGASPPPPPPSSAAAAGSAPRVTAIQHGFAVRGSVAVRTARSRLQTRARASRVAVSGGHRAGTVSIGSQLRRSVAAGRASFAVKLSAAARKALHRHGRLAVTVTITVTPPTGKAYTGTRKVSMRVAAAKR